MRGAVPTHSTYSHIDHSPGSHVDSMREAVFIVSPKMENLGSLLPTSPVTCTTTTTGEAMSSAFIRGHMCAFIRGHMCAFIRGDAPPTDARFHIRRQSTVHTYAGPGVDADPDDDRLSVVWHQYLQVATT